MEHHANDLPWQSTAIVEYIDVDKLGRINIKDIENKLKKEMKLNFQKICK